MQKYARASAPGEDFLSEYLSRRIFEGIFILSIATSIFLLIALSSYHSTDPAWSHSALHHHVINSGGRVGAWLADVLLYVFGYFAYLLPLVLTYGAWVMLREQGTYGFDYRLFVIRATGFTLLFIAGCGITSLVMHGHSMHLPFTSGGIMGDVIAQGLASLLNELGTGILLIALLLIGVSLFTGASWFDITEGVGRYANLIFVKLKTLLINITKNVHSKFTHRNIKRLAEKRIQYIEKQVKRKPKKGRKVAIEKPANRIIPSVRYEKERQVPIFDAPIEGTVPPLTLLDPPDDNKEQGYSNETLEDMSREVEQRLLDFGVDVQVVAVHPGPVITRFELQLAAGVKVSKISGLAIDLARSLSVTSVRVVEVIPGKSVVGIELPNEKREMVRLTEVLSSKQYDQARSPLSMALGKDIAGHPVIVDLAKMPHLLVAGTTGSGKSVGLNAMLLSFLFKTTPEELRLILIDPKMLELSIYDGIPHLLTPVVTNMKEAANSLRWGVAEMERRYRLMAALGVRNLAGFNNKVRDAIKKEKPLLDPLWQPVNGVEHPNLETIPNIVIVIDELADMMMVVGKKVEQLIARIAQKARASGIHLILATQRPSVDVLTGLIKSNIPTRISFQVSSKIDSRTILDQQGAEQLLGHGDMLYLAPGTGAPVRIHGAFVDDHEVHKVTSNWKRRGEPTYIDNITAGMSDSGEFSLPGEGSDATEDTDALYDQVVQFVTEGRRVSISSVQRRFKIGYNRAARLVEEMERTGVVSPMESNGSREVLAPPPAEIG